MTQTHPAQPQYSPSTDEVLMAAVAHGSVFLSIFGPIGPILVWISQRRKSAYASFHALQALGYQMAFYWVGIAAALILVIGWGSMVLPDVSAALQENPQELMSVLEDEGFITLVTVFTWGIFVAGGVLGALMCWLKKDFRYPWLGRRLETFLKFDANSGKLDVEAEERFIASMAHASAILFLTGMLTPIAVWVTQKSTSTYLRFQALQAAVYQALALVGYFFFLLAYAALFIFLGLLFIPASAQSEAFTIAMLVLILVILLVLIAGMLALPTYHLFAMIAGIQILKGRDYHYPVLGAYLARRIQPKTLKG